MLRNDRLIRVLRGEPVDTVPVWIMRQAGRYLPQYRKVREQAGDFLTLCKTPELACEVTLQPVSYLGVDAAILFSDILVTVEAMGVPLHFAEGEGPRLEPVRDEAAISALTVPDVQEKLRYVFDAIRLVRKALDGQVPLIGFAGAPFTLLTYAVEGKTGKQFSETKRLLFTRPDLAHALLRKITDTTILYLEAQIAAGAQVLQLFDSWVGILGPDEFSEFAAPYAKEIFTRLQATNVPLIYFPNGGATLLEAAGHLGAHAIGVDWRLPLGRARALVGPHTALQGNLDPTLLFASVPTIEKRAQKILAETGGIGHVFNLGHGILPETNPEHARALVEAVHQFRVTRSSTAR